MLDIDDILEDGTENKKKSSFVGWIQTCIVKPYGYRIPHTVQYLLKKLEIEDDQEIQFLLQGFMHQTQKMQDQNEQI